ncbi:MAG: class I SAM-dependent methyltransferase [Sphingomicrobium sp.]
MRSICLALLMAATTLPATAHAAPANVKASVAATGARTEANVKLDASRKPVQMLAFLGLQKGLRVVDMFGANQYWAEIIAPAVGPKGHVTVWQPAQFLNDKRRESFAAFAAKQKNVTLISSPFEAPALPRNAYDFMLMNLDYHDVYWQSAERKIPRMEPRPWLRALYASMKPGGIVGIIDHSAAPGGNTRAVVEKLHRIDEAVVLADFKRAGFQLVGRSNLLRNRADNRSLSVFDEKIRGKTDRFILKFRKPR